MAAVLVDLILQLCGLLGDRPQRPRGPLRARPDDFAAELAVLFLPLRHDHVVRDLQPGETLRVHPGHVGAFQSSVAFQITTVPGIKNMIFGGDGIFLAALTGPGRIWLQTLPIAKLAHAIDRYLPHEVRRESVEGGVVGGIVGSILDGMK